VLALLRSALRGGHRRRHRLRRRDRQFSARGCAACAGDREPRSRADFGSVDVNDAARSAMLVEARYGDRSDAAVRRVGARAGAPGGRSSMISVACATIDAYPVVPIYQERQITKLGPERERSRVGSAGLKREIAGTALALLAIFLLGALTLERVPPDASCPPRAASSARSARAELRAHDRGGAACGAGADRRARDPGAPAPRPRPPAARALGAALTAGAVLLLPAAIGLVVGGGAVAHPMAGVWGEFAAYAWTARSGSARGSSGARRERADRGDAGVESAAAGGRTRLDAGRTLTATRRLVERPTRRSARDSCSRRAPPSDSSRRPRRCRR
jgi:hypothetical protein